MAKKKCKCKACKKADKKDNSKLGDLGSLDEWCSEHWFLTFLLVSSALAGVKIAVSNLTEKSTSKGKA